MEGLIGRKTSDHAARVNGRLQKHERSGDSWNQASDAAEKASVMQAYFIFDTVTSN